MIEPVGVPAAGCGGPGREHPLRSRITRPGGLELAALLDPHTPIEERSLFAKLRADPEFAPHVENLCEEHQEINHRLMRVVDGDLAGAGGLERLLGRHIDKEENGLFPQLP